MKIYLFIILLLLSCSHHPQDEAPSYKQVPTDYKNGVLKSLTTLKAGVKDGPFYFWDNQGKLIKYVEYSNGKPLGIKKQIVGETEFCYKITEVDITGNETDLGVEDLLGECAKSTIWGQAKSFVNPLIDEGKSILTPYTDKLFKSAIMHENFTGDLSKASLPTRSGIQDGILTVANDYKEFGVGLIDLLNGGVPDFDTTGLGTTLLELKQKIESVSKDPYSHGEKAVHGFMERWKDQVDSTFALTGLPQKDYHNYAMSFLSGFAITETLMSYVAVVSLKTWGPGLKSWIKARRVDGYSYPSKKKVTKLSKVSKRNPNSRLPENNGEWKGGKGESPFVSRKKAVLKVTKGKGIPFYNDRPNFTRWSKASYSFKKGELKGNSNDFTLIHRKIAQQKGMKNAEEAIT